MPDTREYLPATPTPKKDEMIFIPLGGCEQFGINMNLYGHDGRWLLVDLGIGFGDETMPGVDLLLPDPDFISDRANKLDGLIVTHAHEDHVGGVAHLWDELGCPIYATALTIEFLKRKFEEDGGDRQPEFVVMQPGERYQIGNFEVEPVEMAHSVPQCAAMIIRTAAGTVVHTADWKLDDEPLTGWRTNMDRLGEVGEEGVLAIVGDSTNAGEPGYAGSEKTSKEALTGLIGKLKNRIVVTCFSSNVARVMSVIEAAKANGRDVAIVGRSLKRMLDCAVESGVIEKMPTLVPDREAGAIPRDKIVYICTGTQGEPRAALSRLSRDDHPFLALEQGDNVIYSSRDIPGNQRAIGWVKNQLIGMGVNVITPDDVPGIHVSGHGSSEDLTQVYQLLKPQIVVPVHGETANLHAHAELAAKLQIPTVIEPENGTAIRLAETRPEIVGQVLTGILTVDGDRIGRLDDGAVVNRRRLSYAGVISVSVAIDTRGELLADPKVEMSGVASDDDEDELIPELVDAIEKAIINLPRPRRADDGHCHEAARLAVRRRVKKLFDKKPVIHVAVMRV
ncbi:MAG: ribonuclease J [Alphaproteobacteria bacterium]